MKYLLTSLLALLVFSCSQKDEVPKGILKTEKMQLLFWDFLRAEVYSSNFAKRDSIRSEAIENLKIQNKIFKMHNVTKEEFYRSYIYYSNHKELMTKMIDSMIAIQKREKELKNKKDSLPVRKPDIKQL